MRGAPMAQEMRKSGSASGPMRDFGRAPLRVGLLLWPSFPLMSLAGIVESLRHAGDHGDASQNRYTQWDVVGAPGKPILSSCGIPIETTVDYPRPDRFDYLFVIGGLLNKVETAPAAHWSYLWAAQEARHPIIGVCTGSFVLAEAGLLEGKPVCVHPYHARDFSARFAHLRTVLNRDFVTDGNVTTVLGGVSILPLMTRIIGAHFGADRSAKTVHQMTLPAPDLDAGPQARTLVDHDGISDPRIQQALVMLEAHASTNPNIAALARSLGLSERHFLRLFRAQVGVPPKTYLVDSKLRAAIWMLRHTRRSITEVAYAAGFSSGASLSDHCRRRFGQTPSALRREAKTGTA